jgi:uncharacterized membrane protein HdeD (DUF308 family)
VATVPEGGSGPDIRDQFVRLGRSWGVYLFFGAVCIVVGIMVLVWPDHTLVALAVLFGLQLIISGLFHLLAAVASTDANAGSRVLGAVIGLLGLVIGLYALRHIDIALSALALVLAIYWICDGVVRIFAALDYPDFPGQVLRIVVGVLAITAGTIVLIWPHPSLLVLAVILGVWLLMFGVLQIFIAIGIRAGAEPG